MLTLTWLTLVAQLPVIPGAHGYGITTPAGRGGTVYVVRSLAASGPDTLEACVTASGPRVCVFEVSGTITLTANLEIINGQLTIAGQTAPSPGILIRGAGLLIRASDVLVQHLRVRVGDDPSGPRYVDRDALQIVSFGSSVARRVVIDHCSFSWSVDEVISVWSDSGLDAGFDDVTLRSNVFSEPLNDSFHTTLEDGGGVTELHGFGPILGGDPNPNGHVDLVGNLFAFNVSRNPLSGATNLALVNNVIYGVDQLGATQLLAYDADPTSSSVVGNVYRRAVSPVIRLTALPPGSRVYLADNLAPGALSDQWSEVEFFMGGSRAALEVTSPPAWPSGLVAQPASATLASVLANAGARPVDRDAVDARVVASVNANTGTVINCVSADGSPRCAANGGGWPVLAQNTRPLTLPANPNGDDDGDGYTNLEEWLHGFSAAVEGSPVTMPPVRFSPDALHGQRTDWEELTPSRWAVVSLGGDWRWGITTSSYSATPTSGLGEYALSRHGTFEDFRLTARFASTEDLTANPGADVCLVFGYEGPDDYLYVMLSALAANNQLFRYQNGTRTLLADLGASLVPDVNWHDVVLERTGATVRLSLDGTQRFQGSVTDFPVGRVGVGSFNDAVAFDDVHLDALATDGGVVLVDAGQPDAGTANDAGTALDAGAGDAGVASDAGSLVDAGMPGSPDGGAGTDGGPTGDVQGSGCGCASVDASAVLLAVVLGLRQRRRRSVNDPKIGRQTTNAP
ncbi:MAG: hypothetical protein U0228_15245 [Myxococcaceae bacterium]